MTAWCCMHGAGGSAGDLGRGVEVEVEEGGGNSLDGDQGSIAVVGDDQENCRSPQGQ